MSETIALLIIVLTFLLLVVCLFFYATRTQYKLVTCSRCGMLFFAKPPKDKCPNCINVEENP